MINERKVAAMTRMAAYEAGEGKKDFSICGYFRSDYVGFQLLKTWIGTTIAFGILAGIYLMYRMDEVMDSLYGLDAEGLLGMGKQVLIAYVIFCGVYLLATYIIAHVTYHRAFKSLARFDKALKVVDGDTEEPEE